jgi:hypothetical protein
MNHGRRDSRSYASGGHNSLGDLVYQVGLILVLIIMLSGCAPKVLESPTEVESVQVGALKIDLFDSKLRVSHPRCAVPLPSVREEVIVNLKVLQCSDIFEGKDND